MSVTSARDWQRAEQSQSDRSPLSVTGVTVALLALGFGRSRASPPAEASGNRSRLVATRRGRGRAATHPLEVPPRGWKDVLLRIWKNIARIASSSLPQG
jgi:hypothetical protein